MSDSIEIPEFVLAKVGALTLELEAARREIGRLKDLVPPASQTEPEPSE